MTQAGRRLIAAIKDNREEDSKALWLDDTLTPLDRAKALYYSLLFQTDRIAEWLLDHFDMPLDTGEALLNANGMGNISYVQLFFNWHTPSEALLRAAIRKHVPGNRCCSFDLMHGAGGWALVLHALESGCELDPPSSAWCSNPKNFSGSHVAMVAKHQGFHGITRLRAFHALHTGDLKLLSHTVGGASQFGRFARGFALFGFLKTAMDCPSLACLDVLLDLGSNWRAAAFWAAFLEGNVSILDHVMQRQGGLGPPGTPIPCIPFWGIDVLYDGALCGKRSPWFVESPSVWAAKLSQSSTLGGFLPTCVAALVDAAKAGCLETEIRRWRETAPVVLVWWGRQCRAHAQRQGTDAIPHVPEVLALILGHAGIASSEEFRRAAPLAASICRWLGVHFPLLQEMGNGKYTWGWVGRKWGLNALFGVKTWFLQLWQH